MVLFHGYLKHLKWLVKIETEETFEEGRPGGSLGYNLIRDNAQLSVNILHFRDERTDRRQAQHKRSPPLADVTQMSAPGH